MGMRRPEVTFIPVGSSNPSSFSNMLFDEWQSVVMQYLLSFLAFRF